MQLAPRELLDGRLAAIRRALIEQDVETLLVSHLPNIFYLTNVSASAGLLVITPRIVYLIIDFRYSAAVAELVAGGAVPTGLEVVVAPASLDEAAAELIREHGTAVVGVEGAHLTVDQFGWWGRALASRRLHPAGRLVEQARLVKDAFEIGLFRRAGALISQVANTVLRDAVVAGRSELDIAADIDWQIKRAGFSRPAFDTIVASGPNAALPHARPTSRRLEDGDLVVLDFGGVYAGYCVDVTRTVAMGRPSEDARSWYGAVKAAQDAAMAAIRPGVLAHVVDGAARRSLESAGLAEAFGHSTGHGLGLDVHEDPRVGRELAGRPSAVLHAGMVCTVEPGVYFPGLGGVRIEDDVLVTEDGYERLTDIPYALAEN